MVAHSRPGHAGDNWNAHPVLAGGLVQRLAHGPVPRPQPRSGDRPGCGTRPMPEHEAAAEDWLSPAERSVGGVGQAQVGALSRRLGAGDRIERFFVDDPQRPLISERGDCTCWKLRRPCFRLAGLHTGKNGRMLDIAELAPGLERRSDGIWSASRPSQISYPDHGNAACLQVEDRSFWFVIVTAALPAWFAALLLSVADFWILAEAMAMLRKGQSRRAFRAR